MIFVRRAVLVCCIILAGCIIGVLLQGVLPTQHMAAAKTAITTIQGLVTLLLALVCWGSSSGPATASIRSTEGIDQVIASLSSNQPRSG